MTNSKERLQQIERDLERLLKEMTAKREVMEAAAQKNDLHQVIELSRETATLAKDFEDLLIERKRLENLS